MDSAVSRRNIRAYSGDVKQPIRHSCSQWPRLYQNIDSYFDLIDGSP